MKVVDWKRLIKVDELSPDKVDLYKGDRFLTGKSMIGQLEVKKIGDDISYYKVIRTEGKNIEYMLINDILEEV